MRACVRACMRVCVCPKDAHVAAVSAQAEEAQIIRLRMKYDEGRRAFERAKEDRVLEPLGSAR